MNIYRELLQDHYHHPRNKRDLATPDFTSNQENPSCGDSIKFQGNIQNNTLKIVTFTGSGCVISQATASLLTELAFSKTIAEILAFDVSTILNLIGMQLGPVRLKCALLPLQALQEGLKNYKNAEVSTNAESCKSDKGIRATIT